MHRISTCFFACLLLGSSQCASAQDASSFEERVKDLQHLDGFFDLYWDRKSGQLLLEIDRFDEEFIYQSSMPRGVGSNDLGLDRGQLGSTRMVEFSRFGPKILMIENNLDYRANSDNPAEIAAVEGSFARSVIWGFEILFESGESALVDATGFFLRDSHGIGSSLARAGQGSYAVDATRSAIFMPRTRAFQDNTEVEAIITYTGSRKFDETGSPVSSILPTVVPDPTAITVHLHHSLVRAPDQNYTPLPYDPRAGLIGLSWEGGFFNYSTRVGESLTVNYGRRHRLKKKDPAAELSEAIEPIIYYVDSGVPEPVRSALVEGASWWNEAFSAAGYKDAFQVALLPADADPMDVRYNVIQWVHRSTRGWSYGASVVDPRSGEIIKGHVSLGSLRVRQDYLIAEGLLAPYAGNELPVKDTKDPMLEMSLARIRQLSAHEVGHTIGMEHNFAASMNNRASVMDYPFPLIRFDEDGDIDLSDAYGVGIGDWDKRTVLYAYQDFPDGIDEAAGRKSIMRDTLDSGLLYVADQDARGPGTAHPQANLWDNGADAMVELEHLLRVREYALSHFSENNIRPDRPLATAEEALVPLYLIHRFQVQAVAKLIGGQYFNYSMRGDGQAPTRIVGADRQHAAIAALLKAIDPEVLVLPRHIVDLISARPPGHPLTRETFSRNTGVIFDPLTPAASAVSLTLDVLLNQQRAARMNAFHAANPELPGFDHLLAELVSATWQGPRHSATEGAIERATAFQVLNRLMVLATDAGVTSGLKAQALMSVQGLGDWLAEQSVRRLGTEWKAHYVLASHQIGLMLDNPAWFTPSQSRPAPPGSPIGN